MKKHFIYASLALASFAMTACSDDKNEPVDEGNKDNQEQTSADLDYSSANATAWHNYMRQVSQLLVNDADQLYKAWTESYEGGESFADQFRRHDNAAYSSASSCIQQIIEGCVDIATEVGEAKIGEPYNLYRGGNTTAALYAVESWYSWHSIDDYSNNIISIRNAYNGSRDGSVAQASIKSLVAAADPALDAEVQNAIDAAYKAIKTDMPAPFRNNINKPEVLVAMEACASLGDVLDMKLRPVAIAFSEAQLQPVVENYVDRVVLPTYADLKAGNQALHNAVLAFIATPSDANMAACAQAWLDAREPWETSEAFHFGPVDALNLDPNMDSWPLDQDQIVQILTSGSFDDLNWNDSQDDDAIEAAQSVRGFHTLEYLIFKNGKARIVE